MMKFFKTTDLRQEQLQKQVKEEQDFYEKILQSDLKKEKEKRVRK